MQNRELNSSVRDRGAEPARSERRTAAASVGDEGASTGKPLEPTRPSRRGAIGAALIGLLVLAGGGIGVMEWGNQAPHVGITTTLGQGEPYGGSAFLASDALVTDKQWQERADAFKAFTAKGPVQLDRADDAQTTAYLDKVIADPQQRQALLAQVREKQVDLAAVGLYDDCAEDGDVVAVTSGAVHVFVSLTHQVQYVLVPVPHGGNATVNILGQGDGQGGGITVGMIVPGGAQHLPRLVPGQQISFAVK